METINDSVRKVAVEMMNTSMQDITVKVINGWAMRLGATCKKSLPFVNAAKMREALEFAVEQLIAAIEDDSLGDNILYLAGCMRIVANKCKVALAAAPRNCDLYSTPKDAMLAHLAEVYEGEKVEFGDYEWCEFVKWLFAEAEGEKK